MPRVRSARRWRIKMLLSTRGGNKAFNTAASHSREKFVRDESKSVASTHQNLAATDNFLKFTANLCKTWGDTLPTEVLKTLKQNTTCEKFSFTASFTLLPVHMPVRSVRTYDWFQHKLLLNDFHREAFIWIYLLVFKRFVFFLPKSCSTLQC